jgi:hypothetical protein
MTKTKFYLLLFCCIYCVGCENEEAIQTAKKVTLEQIINESAFHWYNPEYNNYQCNQAIIDSIKNDFNKDELKIIIFTSPTCDCGSDEKHLRFPQLMKVLNDANITADNYEIYITRDENINFKHPYSNTIKIYSMPAFYILKNGKNVFSITGYLSNMENENIEIALLEGI